MALSRSHRFFMLVLGAACAVAAAPNFLLGQTWDGGGADNNWTTVANWNPDGAPANNGTANIIIGGFTRLLPSVNAAHDILSLAFNNPAGAFTIGGTGPLTIRAGGITNNDTDTQTINTPITLQASQTWNSAAGQLRFGGSSVTRNNFDLTIDGSFQTLITNTIPGGGNLIKNGTGTLLLGGSTEGGCVINAGTLQITASDVLPYTDVFVGANATLNINGFTDTISFLNAPSGTATVSLPTTSSLTVDGASIPLNGVISGDSTATFTKVSGNQLRLAGNNTFSGTYRVVAGSLQTLASERLADSADVVVEGGFLDTQSFTETVDVITLKSGGIFNNTGGVLIGSAYNLESGFVQKNLGGSAALTKSTTGIVELFTPCSYTGPTDINAGTLRIMNHDLLPDTASVTVSSGATLSLNGFNNDTIGALTGSGAVQVPGTSTWTVGGGNASSTFSGVISGPGSLAKTGTGIFTLSGANTYTGVTTVSAGAFSLGASGVLDDSSDLTVIGGSFNLQSFSETVDIVTLVGGSITGTGTLSASAFNVESGTISANLVGSTALTKNTAGTVTLNGTNAYTGETFLNAGVLEAASQNGLPSGGSLTFDGGTVRTTATTTISGPITFVGSGTIDTVVTTTLSGSISGNGGLTKEGLGTLRIDAPVLQLAGLTVNTGDLELPIGGTLIVTGGMTLGSDGLLSLDGGLISANSFTNGGEIELLGGARLNGPMTNSGVIAGEGRISGALTNDPTGEVLVTGGESLQFASTAPSTNAGALDVLDAELEFDGELTNLASTGLIFARDALLRFNGGLINAGSVALSFGITDIFGDIENQNGASMVISGGSDATFVDDVVNDGMIRVSQGSAAVFFGAVSGGGSFPGTGTVFLEGDLRPGASPARIEFGGDLVLGSGASLALEIGGTTPGDEYDQIVVAGEASLGGTLRVLLIDGFVPVVDQSFEIISYGSKTGAFAVVELPSVEGLCIDLVVEGTSMTVVVESATAFGDVNGDCNVDLSDFLSLSECLNGPNGGPNAPGCDIFDFGADDDVDLRDVAYFQTAFTGY